MCMLIYHPADATPFSREELDDFSRLNTHGFGAIWRTPTGAVRYRKGMMARPQIWQLYQTLRGNGCHEMALHWRFATAGAVNYDNCHPIAVPVGGEPGVLLMHNGARIGPSTYERSDSRVFAEDALGPVLAQDTTVLQDQKWVGRLAGEIGGGNRLLIWDQLDPSPVIVGEDRGMWFRGRWYSNTYAWSAPRAARWA